MLTILLVQALAGAWTLNDVSMLLPLPKAEEVATLLDPRTDGGRGELLPRDVYADLPTLVVGGDPDEIYDELLRVVAVRFDPCFREDDGPCRRQIRLVWQPVMARGARTITADAAVHTFYDLDEAAWADLLRALIPLTAPDGDDALDVHPRIRREGLRGPHWTKLRALIARFAGARNLTRATAMTVNLMGSVWAFTGLEMRDGGRKRLPVPRTKKVAQAVQVDLSDLSELRVNLAPTPEASPSWLSALFDSRGVDAPTARAAWEEARRLEDPRRAHTGNVDCASCHLAQIVRLWAERRLPGLPGSPPNNSVNPGQTNRLRAFGYMLDEPVLAQRVIFESAEVLARFRASY